MGLHEFLKEKKWKKMRKDQWLILLLTGVLLLVIAVPADCGGSSEGEKEKTSETEDKAVPSEDYESVLEERLSQVLSQIDGVGRVRVMITLKDGGESVVEKDVTSSQDTQEGTEDGSQTKSEHSEETVYSSKSGDGEPFISKQTKPEVEGVLVVAQGGDNTKVAENISEAVEALFSVDAHKIKVVKMNLQEGSN